MHWVIPHLAQYAQNLGLLMPLPAQRRGDRQHSRRLRRRRRGFDLLRCDLLGEFDEVSLQDAKHVGSHINPRAELNSFCETGLKASASDETQKGRAAIQSLHPMPSQQMQVSPRQQIYPFLMDSLFYLEAGGYAFAESPFCGLCNFSLSKGAFARCLSIYLDLNRLRQHSALHGA
ncbi:hypothetical protein PO78_1769 [Thauera sp. SWB20]|nr:hypothetical protein PO78_1769 [Thauera sp. SWB20]